MASHPAATRNPNANALGSHAAGGTG